MYLQKFHSGLTCGPSLDTSTFLCLGLILLRHHSEAQKISKALAWILLSAKTQLDLALLCLFLSCTYSEVT